MSDWFVVSQALIDAFAELTQDRQWIHCDPERARSESPMGTTIAHGFLTLEEDTEAFYLVSAFYAPERERGVRWNDPRFAIRWPAEPLMISDKDTNQRDFDPAWHLEA